MPKTRSEKEIAGYRDVLATIHENYEYIPVSSNMILQLHEICINLVAMDTVGILSLWIM